MKDREQNPDLGPNSKENKSGNFSLKIVRRELLPTAIIGAAALRFKEDRRANRKWANSKKYQDVEKDTLRSLEQDIAILRACFTELDTLTRALVENASELENSINEQSPLNTEKVKKIFGENKRNSEIFLKQLQNAQDKYGEIEILFIELIASKNADRDLIQFHDRFKKMYEERIKIYNDSFRQWLRVVQKFEKMFGFNDHFLKFEKY